jgi:DNA repair photolyase
MMSGVTDCYQPIERKLELTRRCLKVLADARNPVAVISKNGLIARDADVFQELAKYKAASCYVSVTTLDNELHRRLEPRTSTPQGRLKAIETLAKAGVPVGVNVAPVIVGLNDHELPAILKAAADAGATSAGYIPLRLPFAVAPLFEKWLDEHYPLKKEKVLSQIRSLRGGKLNDPNFGSRMEGEGVLADHLNQLFHFGLARAGINGNRRGGLSAENFRKPLGDQLRLI